MEGFEILKTKRREENKAPDEIRPPGRVKFQIYGEEMIDKKVMRSGASGRVYLPPDWVGRYVKVIKID